MSQPLFRPGEEDRGLIRETADVVSNTYNAVEKYVYEPIEKNIVEPIARSFVDGFCEGAARQINAEIEHAITSGLNHFFGVKSNSDGSSHEDQISDDE